MLVAILILGLFGAAIIWQTFALRALRDAPLPSSPKVIHAPVSTDHLAIAKLFNPPNTEAAKGSSQHLADLTLHGSFVHEAIEKSSALIAKAGAPASRYRLHSQIDDHTWLRQVARDHVLIERNGRTEYLHFPAAVRSTEHEDQHAATALREQMMEQLREQMEAASDETLLPVSQTAMDSE